jgi:NACHT domain
MEKILRWLSPPDPSSNFQKALKQRQSGTGVWFLQHERYIRWKSGKSQFLWLHGIPGCGKSVLSSTILENVLELVKRSAGSVVTYFYFDFNDPQKQVPELMIRSLLAQLLRSYVEIPAVLETLFSSCDKGQRQPSLNEYLEVLRQIIKEIPRMYLVLDALDECDTRDELLEIFISMADWNAGNLHILLTSRKERDIEDSFTEIVDSENIICIQSNLVDPDIRAYILERLSKDKDLKKWHKDSEIRGQIEHALMEKASGMYALSCGFWFSAYLDTGFDGPLVN